jgi:hypothetical protein
MVDSLSADGFVADSVLDNAIKTAKTTLGVNKAINANDIVDYSFLAEALKKQK